MDGIVITRGVSEDAPFLARATVLAERAHLPRGMWDLLFGVQDVLAVPAAMRAIEHVIRAVPESHVHHRRFYVARDTAAASRPDGTVAAAAHPAGAAPPLPGRAVGSSCWYLGAEATAAATFAAAAARIAVAGPDDADVNGPPSATPHGWGTPEAAKAAMDRVAFLSGGDGVWPDIPVYEGSQFVESVFVADSHRRRGIAGALVRRCLADGRVAGAARCVILSEIGNLGSRTLYERCGLRCVGQFLSNTCLAELGAPGFDLLIVDFDPASASASLPAQGAPGSGAPLNSANGPPVPVATGEDSGDLAATQRAAVQPSSEPALPQGSGAPQRRGQDQLQQQLLPRPPPPSQQQQQQQQQQQPPQSHSLQCACGCVPQNVKSLFEMAALRKKFRAEQAAAAANGTARAGAAQRQARAAMRRKQAGAVRPKTASVGTVAADASESAPASAAI